MCGITALSRAQRSSIRDGRRLALAALLCIEERGPDSTGIAWTRGKQAKVWYHKLVGPASRVAAHLDIDGKYPMRTFVGHTRWSTNGAHTYDNAHPVVADHITLVHNGIVSNDDALVEFCQMAEHRVGEVDSWSIAALLSQQEMLGAESPAELLELVRGDAAVAWLNSEDPRALHLARIKGRPMTLGFTRRGDLLMSSTRGTLMRTARMADVRIEDIVDVPEGTYLRVVDGKILDWVPFNKAPATPKPTHTPSAPAAVPPRAERVRTQQRSFNWDYDQDAIIKHRREMRDNKIAGRAFPKRGITDLVSERPDDWWEESERLLGDAIWDQ